MLRPNTLVFFTIALTASPGAAHSTYDEVAAGFDFVTVGDPGNAGLSLPDPTTRWENHLGRGSVDYSYRIARTEVTQSQYIEFVNNFTVLSDDINNLLTTGVRWIATIDRDYFGQGERWMPSRPGVEDFNVSARWFQAAMFVNWLHHGKTTNYDDILSGVYDISAFTQGGPLNGQQVRDAVRRSEDARFWLPSLDELLKAGWYDPEVDADGDGEAEGGWWTFPNRSHEAPVSGLPGEGETARGVDDDALDDLFAFNRRGTMPIGLYPETMSAYGLLDLSGSGHEWTDSLAAGRELQASINTVGSSEGFDESLGILLERADSAIFSSANGGGLHFRIATVVPNPSVVMCAVLCSCVWTSRRRSWS